MSHPAGPMLRCLALCGLAALALLSGCKEDVSGTYLVADKVSVCWLQIVRTPDDRLTGQIVSAVLNPDGEIEHSSVSFNGAMNGENITLTGGGFLGMATITLSGTFNRNVVTLTGVRLAPVSMKRATLAEYQVELGGQTKRSEEIIAARAMAAKRQRTFHNQMDFLAQLDQLIGQMQKFDEEADLHLGRFANAEKSYEAVTAKVEDYVTRERELAGNPSRGVERSQLGVAALEASLNTGQIHFQVQALQSSLETIIAPVVTKVTALEQGCRQSGTVDANLTPEEKQARESACGRLLDSGLTFHEKFVATRIGLNQLEEVYQRERNTQARLLAAAEKMD